MRKFLSFILALSFVLPGLLALPEIALANTKVRQEINITDAYMFAGSGAYATSSEIVALTDSNYTSPTYYFEVVASTTAGTTASVSLVNATSSAIVKTISITGGNSYQLYRSSAFATSSQSAVEYKVVLNNEAIGKGIIASRIVVLQNASTLSSTETQIEIGDNVIATTSTATTPMANPKYWYYDSTKWDGSPTFTAEVTYNTSALLASSTIYNVNGTKTYVVSSTTKYTTVEAWGAGGGGAITTTTGGGGGGGGAYARSTTTPTIGSSHTLVIGKGGTADNGTPATNSTYDSTTVVADHGLGATVGSGVSGGLASNSTGATKFDGGSGGLGVTTNDTNGGGGGAGGTDGAGEKGADAQTSLNGDGGRGDNTFGGTAGTKATFGAGTTGGNGGASALGGGGGGGSGNNNSGATGSNGGSPGGGGGGEDGGTVSPTGADGQIKLTEWGGFYVGIAIEESDGTGDGFVGWTFKKQIVAQGQATTTTRVRSASFTPTSGRNYRLVASTTNAIGNYSIYNAKIVVNQTQINNVASQSETNNTTSTALRAGSATEEAQCFTPSKTGTLDHYDIYSRKNGSPTGNAVALVYAVTGSCGDPSNTATPTGAALATSDNFDVSTFPASFKLNSFNFSGVNRISLSSATTYFISIQYTGGDVSNDIFIGQGNNIAPVVYTAGNAASFSGSWLAESSFDDNFYVYLSVSVPSLLQPQYLLAPTKLFTGTSLQTYLTSWDSTEWSTTNAYVHQVESANNSTSVAELDTSGGVQVTNSPVTSPDNRATSTAMCMPATGNLDVKATTNNNDIFASRILVDVGGTPAICGGASLTPKFTLFSKLIIGNGLFIIP